MISYGILNGSPRAKQAYVYVTMVVHLLVVLTHVTFGRAYEFVGVDWADVLVEKLDPSLEGPTPCYSLIMKVRPKQLGGLESYYFVMPHIDPMRCLFWALGLVLFTYFFILILFSKQTPFLYLSFTRVFQVFKIPEPDYANNADWKQMCLIPGRSDRSRGKTGTPCIRTRTTTTELSPLLKNMHKAFNLVLAQLLHAGRKGGSQAAVATMSSTPGVCGKSIFITSKTRNIIRIA